MDIEKITSTIAADLRPSLALMVLASGQVIRASGIMLYPAEMLAKIAAERAAGIEKLGGMTTGIGFIGSPGWALGAGAALGIVEGMLSSVAKKDGLRILADCDARFS